MAEARPRTVLALVLALYLILVTCYEKNLRNIVRNQSKMVQKPFSDVNSADLFWTKASHGPSSSGLIMSGFLKKTIVNKQRRISTIVSGMEPARGKLDATFTNPASSQEPRLSRKTLSELLLSNNSLKKPNVYFPEANDIDVNGNLTNDFAIQNFYQVIEPPRALASLAGSARTQGEVVGEEVLPEYNTMITGNNTTLIKALYIPKAAVTSMTIGNTKHNSVVTPRMPEPTESNENPDFLIPADYATRTHFTYNSTGPGYSKSCSYVLRTEADIDAQKTYLELDIEPPWMPAKTYWRSIFETRYTTLMRSSKWPSLKVILVPRTQVDSIWKDSFEQIHNNTAHKILTNLVRKLNHFKNLTFTWNEVSHLSEWWKTTSNKNRMTFRRLCRSKRLEITTGGWVSPDEATTHLFGLLHQLLEGHLWLKSNLNYSPRTAWASDSVSHSPTMPYLLASCGVPSLVIAHLHYSWEQHLAEYQQNDFIWLQSWHSGRSSAPSPLNQLLHKLGKDRLPTSSVLTHYLQFDSAGFAGCGPNGSVCENEFDFSRGNDLLDVNAYNVKSKAERLLEQYSKTGTTTLHNVIIAPIGDAGHFSSQSEFDLQYANYKKIADFVNANSEVYKANITFGTPRHYFETMTETQKTFPTLTGDFVNFADVRSGAPAYWSGYFTTRPLLKMRLRRLEATLRSAEILVSFAVNLGVLDKDSKRELYKQLSRVRVQAARLSDRHVSRGTLPAASARRVHELLLLAVRACWRLQEHAASFLTIRPGHRQPYLQKYVYREGEFVSIFRSVSPGDQIYLFNPLSQERTEIVELITRTPNIRIIDHNKRDVTVQVNPMWRYTSNDEIDISKTFYKIIFIVQVSPMTLALLRVSSRHPAAAQLAAVYCSACPAPVAPAHNTQHHDTHDEDTLINDAPDHASHAFNIQSTLPGDIQLESYKHRLLFDENSGLLKMVIEKETNTEKIVVLNYGAFRTSHVNSGMFLFNTHLGRPLEDVLSPFMDGTKNKTIIIVSGPITTELTTIYGNFIHSTIKIFNLIDSQLSHAIYFETKVDYELSPKYRELELYLSIQTGIANGNNPEIVTDNNGFQYTQRVLNVSRRVESNLYPMTSMVWLQDARSRATLVTEHAQGVTSLQEGHLAVMLDRRVLFDDKRGAGEGLADSTTTFHRYYLLLENLAPCDKETAPREKVVLPSLAAQRLANALTYPLDSFVVDKNVTGHSYYGYLPLIKSSFPCDVSVVNFRSVWTRRASRDASGDSALLVLHRQAFSCDITTTAGDSCNAAADFTPIHIFHYVKSTLHTNLCGTSRGTRVTSLDNITFPPMELITIQVFFDSNELTHIRSV